MSVPADHFVVFVVVDDVVVDDWWTQKEIMLGCAEVAGQLGLWQWKTNR